MEDVYTDLSLIKMLLNYCKFLSQEIRGKDEQIEKLKEELKAKTEKCRQYQNEMVQNSVIQRWKIGKYLHDDLAQKLTFARVLIDIIKNKPSADKADVMAEIDEMKRVINESAREIRDLSHDIIPLNIEKEGVLQAFKYLAEQAKKQGSNCALEADEIINRINNREVATNLYHIAQEAIKNAIVHGEAKNIKIAVIEHNRQLHLHIKDDGKGFDPSGRSEGKGITIMKHRAEEMGGTFRIRSAKEPDHYRTCVMCVLPLNLLAAR